MKHDMVLKAIILGIISTLSYEIVTRLLLSFGVGRYSIYQLNSLIITMDRPNAIIGFVMTSIIATISSVIFYYLIKVVGHEHIITKCILFILVVWAALEVVFTATIEGKYISNRPMSDYYIQGLGAVVFGMTMGILLRGLYSQTQLLKISNSLCRNKKGPNFRG